MVQDQRSPPSEGLRVDLFFHGHATARSGAAARIGIDNLGERPAGRAYGKRPWTLPAPWTRGRAHRSLENRRRFSTAPTAILDSFKKGEKRRAEIRDGQ
jgi:hypothetical protein